MKCNSKGMFILNVNQIVFGHPNSQCPNCTELNRKIYTANLDSLFNTDTSANNQMKNLDFKIFWGKGNFFITK